MVDNNSITCIGIYRFETGHKKIRSQVEKSQLLGCRRCVVMYLGRA